MVESYAKVTDLATINALKTGATDIEATGTGAFEKIMDGVEAILPYAVPTFAVVATDVYRQLILTEDSAKLAYLDAGLGLEGGTAAGFAIVPSDQLSAGNVLVGAREAAISFELSGAPIRVEAENVAQGGFDMGLFGYHAAAVINADALALVAPAA